VHLLIRRRQHDEEGLFSSSVVFELEGRLDLDEEELFLFDKYELSGRVIYNSDAFLQSLYAADQYREAAAKAERDLYNASNEGAAASLAGIVGNSVLAFGYNMLGKVSLQLTLQDLVRGFHIESEDLEEILAVERLTKASVEFLAVYLDSACTFDGSEELSEH